MYRYIAAIKKWKCKEKNGMAKYVLQPILQKRKKNDSKLVTAPDLQCKSRRSCQRLGLHAAAYHTKSKYNKKMSGTDITLQMQKNVLMSTYIPLILRFRVRKDLRKKGLVLNRAQADENFCLSCTGTINVTSIQILHKLRTITTRHYVRSFS